MSSLLARRQAVPVKWHGRKAQRLVATRADRKSSSNNGVHPAHWSWDEEQSYIAVKDLPGSLKEAVLKEVPVTVLRPPPDPKSIGVPDPGMPRAYAAVTAEFPEGSPEMPHPNWNQMTVVQKHVAFWDTDGDGVIWLNDTYDGFKRLGFNHLLCATASTAIHIMMAAWTHEGLPDPRLPFIIKNMHKAKHGSDTEVYDTEGRFVPQKFEELFSKFDKEKKGGLGWDDIQAMARANRNISDYIGWGSERVEWAVFWLLAKDKNGVVSKEACRAMYDGSIFYKIADELEQRERARKQAGKSVPPSFLGREREREQIMMDSINKGKIRDKVSAAAIRR